MVMAVAPVEPASGAVERIADPVGGDGLASQPSPGELVPTLDSAEKLGNPAALGNQMAGGLQDLLQRSETINRLVGDDYRQAAERVQARERGLAIGAPGPSELMGAFAPGAVASAPSALSFGGAAALPGPAERHPGSSLADQWAKLKDDQDRAFLRYIEFAAYQVESSELQKITEQLSQAVNTLVRAS